MTPSELQIGRKIGVKIRQAGVISMNVPTISSRRLMIRRMTYLLLVSESRAAETAAGIFVNAMTQDMMLEQPIRKMMMPVISALSRKIFGSSLGLMER